MRIEAGMSVQTDQYIFSLIKQEKQRQTKTINLIASENYVSSAILEAVGSVLINKYAEGYAAKRYYNGCEYVDLVEISAIERCKKLFNVDHVNVQPHAGSQANLAAYIAILKPGDTILGMSLAEGGHLTHGHPVNISGIIFKSVQYGVNKETELLDYDIIEQLALQYKPKLIIAGASAYSQVIDFKRFSLIAKACGAFLLADIAHIAGLIATRQHPTPVGYADIITSTTHKTLRGPRGGLIMCNQDFAHAVDKAIMPLTQGGPFMHIIAAKAIAFYEALQPDFTIYQQHVIKNAKTMVKVFKEKGYRIVSDGTENHLFVIDLRSKKINGKQAAIALEKAGIIVSKSCIPFDREKPSITSGIRIGTAAITTRGMQELQAEHIVYLIDEALESKDDDIQLTSIRVIVENLCKKFPIYE